MHHIDDRTSNVWRRALKTTSPPEEPTLFEKLDFSFWLCAPLSLSLHLLQACSRNHQMQPPFHFCKGNEVFSDEEEEPYHLNKECLCWPMPNMLEYFMEKDSYLRMPHDLHLFNRCKFCLDYSSSFKLEEKPLQYVNILSSIPFVNSTFSPSIA